METSLRPRHTLMVEDGAFCHKIDYSAIFLGDSKSRRTPKSHYWFKIYGNFAELILPIGGAPAVEGLLSTEPTPSSFLPSGAIKILLPAHIIAYQYPTMTEYTKQTL